MRSWPFLVAAPLALVAAVGEPASSAPRTRGKVVRVERQRSAAAAPRICDVRAQGDGMCFGPEPRLGDIVTVVSEAHVVAEARITLVDNYASRGQACPGLYTINVELVRGTLEADGQTVGVVDRDVHPRNARRLARADYPDSPTGKPSESVQVAIDREGDGVADILLVQSDCDSPGQICLDEWSRLDGRMVRVQQTNFSSCGI